MKIQTLTGPTKFFVYLGDQFSSSASEKYKPFYLEPSAWQRCPCNQLGTGIFHNHISGLRQHEQSSRAALANCTCICERVFIDASTAARWQMLTPTPTLTLTHTHTHWVSLTLSGKDTHIQSHSWRTHYMTGLNKATTLTLTHTQ